ncbi:HutP family protein [bacterium]|nr:HutP family protein [bacterium]
MQNGSKEVSKAAIKLAMTDDRTEENLLKKNMSNSGILCAAIDFGGEFSNSVTKIIERAVVASKREGIIKDTHSEEGAVAGATHEAITQIINKSIGLNVGGKIAIARCESHICVCVFFAVGLLNMNDVVIGLGHRAI